MHTALLLLASLLLATPCFAADDADGCTDSPVINRMSGCSIYECKPREFDAVGVINGPYNADDSTDKTVSVEGRVDQVTYQCPTSVSPLQIIRNFESAFQAKGYKSLYSGKRPVYEGGLVSTLESSGRYAQVFAYLWGESTFYEQILIFPKEMKQELVVDARYLESEIKKHDRVVVYGIEFDSGKATIKQESAKILGEIATVLKSNPAWRFRIEGHTDSVGKAMINLKLSKDRAYSVTEWLAREGIAKARMTSTGFGSTKPLAPNTTEDGRRKNRRVELVKI